MIMLVQVQDVGFVNAHVCAEKQMKERREHGMEANA